MDLQVIRSKIYEVRGLRVMLDYDLAEFYEVATKTLNQAVKRNEKRFPPDFMFQVTNKEVEHLRSQIVTSSWGGTRYMSYAFTQEGVAMLSGILRSEKAIEMNIAIMRAFVLMRQMVIGYEELHQRIAKLEIETNAQFSEIYQALTELLSKKRFEDAPRRPIGYK